MARYEINFTLNGQRYHTSGISSYPTLEAIEKGEINEQIARDNAMIFVSGYMDECHLEGRVNPNTVDWLIFKE